MRRRLVAARRAMGIEGKRVPFAWIKTMPNLGAGESDRIVLAKVIADALRPLGVPLRMIVIDTLRRAMPGKSKNKQEDISIVVDNCEALARAFDALVMLAHHSPRSDDQRGSGSNALDAAAI
jgi:RecA-family ATPase